MALIEEQAPVEVSAAEMLGFLLDDVSVAEFEVNRQAALRMERMLEVCETARRCPDVYAIGADPDMAERGVIADLALRLRASEEQVLADVSNVRTAKSLLPTLWSRARTGFAPMRLVEYTIGEAQLLRAPDGCPEETRTAADAAIAELDRRAAEWVLRCSPVAFRRRVRTFVVSVLGDAASRRHARAMADRKVRSTPAGDGMSWMAALVPTHRAEAAMRRLNSTAKHLQKAERDGRSRDQVRADLFLDWLCGEGTSAPVQTKVFVTIPIQLLAGQPVPVEQARVVGGDVIDPLTAKQIFLNAKSFHRVVTDPIKGVVVDMDRRSYRPTRAQKDWLILNHGTCSRDGCTRLAVDAEFDHDKPWASGGTTDLDQLRPLCPTDHKHRHRLRFAYRTRPDKTVQVTTPTGFQTEPPPPF
ncbi:DUF222 domain-containing protein [Microbacterium sp. NPDC057650]|uniref:HNH endonuclease signature motif containing protein n=1 Tax=unclassified Microbacterium TaxID=2609290 RepID=UPI00366A5627